MTFPLSHYRVLVTGSREWDDEETLRNALNTVYVREVYPFHGWTLIVVHGACPSGADKMASEWAQWARGLLRSVDEERHPADWKEHGKSAGFIRNALMVDLGAEQCLAFFQTGAANKGTLHCADRAEKMGIPVQKFTNRVRESRE